LHPSEELLSAYALDPAGVEDATDLERHLGDCASCRQRVEDFRAIEALLAEPESWADNPPALAPEMLSAIAARNRREDAEADALLGAMLDRFLAETSGALVWADIARKREYHTAGVVRKLAEAADNSSYSVPRRALILAETAGQIVGMLSTAIYSETEIAALRGLAWKQQANANRHLGQFSAALDALNRAERAYRELPRPEIDLASITFIRATIYTEQQTYELAEQLAEESSAAFSQLGQIELYFRSRHLQGRIAFEQSQFGEAQLIFDTIFAYGEAKDDLTWIARASQALGFCHLERRDFGNAARYLTQSMGVFRQLRLSSEQVRCRWGLALLVQREGRFRTAVPRLREVRDEFANLGATSDAALVALDLMETFLLLGQPREVRRTAGNVVKLFKEAGMITGALTAVDYLKQAAAMSSVTPDLIEYIRRYLRRVDVQPGIVFVPPVAL
jgi:tetratricopeptide (TPR) repeat protein